MVPVHTFTLGNGMRFLLAEDHAAPVLAVGLCARAGVADEPADRRGIAHFLEHMMFRGSERFGAKAHAQHLSPLGAQYNAGTGPDYTVYWSVVPVTAVETVFELEADRFLRLRVTQEGTDVERNVILEELRMHVNQPIVRAFREILDDLGGGHPYGLDPLGRAEDVQATTPEDLDRFWRRLYRPDNVFAIVAGDLAPDVLAELAERHFGAWQAPPEPPPGPPPPFVPPTGHRHRRLPIQAPVAARVHRLRPAAEEDVRAVELLVALLAEGETSPLQQRLVRRGHLCVYAGAQNFQQAAGGALVLYGAFLPPGRHERRRAAIRALSERIASDGPDADEVARHLKAFRRARAEHGYSPRERMWGLMHAQAVQGDWRHYADALQQLQAVTPQRVRDVAERLFAPDNTLELDISPEHTPWWMAPLGLALKVVRR